MKEVTILVLDSHLLAYNDSSSDNYGFDADKICTSNNECTTKNILIPEWSALLSMVLKPFLAQKIIDDPIGQYVGTVVHSHPTTSNSLFEEGQSSSYANINVTSPISPVNLDCIDITISGRSVKQPPTTLLSSSPLDTIIVGLDLLINVQDEKAKKTKKAKMIPRKIIFFLASSPSTTAADQSLLVEIQERLKDEDITLEVFDILQSNPFLKSIATSYIATSDINEIATLLAPPLRPKIPRLTSCFVGSLFIGGETEEDSLLSFPIKVYTKTSPSKLPSSTFKKTIIGYGNGNVNSSFVDYNNSSNSNYPINNSNSNSKRESLSSPKIKAFRYGKIFIPATAIPPPLPVEAEESTGTSLNKKGIYVIGFIDKDPKPSYLIGFGYEIVPSSLTPEWMDLHRSLREGSLKIVARQIQKDDGPPRLLLLSPSATSPTLLMSTLPFSNDLREFTFVDKEITATEDQQFLMTKLVKELTVTTTTTNTDNNTTSTIFSIRNPTFQRQMSFILNVKLPSTAIESLVEASSSVKEKCQLAFPPLQKKISNKWINEQERNWNTGATSKAETLKKADDPAKKDKKIVLRVGDNNLLEKLNEMVTLPTEDLVVTAMEQLMSIIAIVACDEEASIENCNGDNNGDCNGNDINSKNNGSGQNDRKTKPKAIDLMKELRKVAISEDEPVPFNTFLMDLKNLPRGPGFPLKFWTSLKEEGIEPLSEGDCLNAPPKPKDDFFDFCKSFNQPPDHPGFKT